MNGVELEQLRLEIQDKPSDVVRKAFLRLMHGQRADFQHVFETGHGGSRYLVGTDGSCLRFKRNDQTLLYTVSPATAAAVIFLSEQLAAEVEGKTRGELYKMLAGTGILSGPCILGATPLEVGVFGEEVIRDGDTVRMPNAGFMHRGHDVSFVHSEPTVPAVRRKWFAEA